MWKRCTQEPRSCAEAGGPTVALTFPFPVPPAPGEVLEVVPGLYSVRMPLPLKLDHVNVWVLDDGDGLLIIDTGIADERTLELLRQARTQLPKKPITRVLVTHHHPDHCGLADRICDGARGRVAHQRAGVRGGAGAAAPLQGHRRPVDRGRSGQARAVAGGAAVPHRQRSRRWTCSSRAMPSRFTALADGDTISVGGVRLPGDLRAGARSRPRLPVRSGRRPGRRRRVPHLGRHAAAEHLHPRGVAGHLAARQSGRAVPAVGAQAGGSAGRHPRPALARRSLLRGTGAGGGTRAAPRAAVPDAADGCSASPGRRRSCWRWSSTASWTRCS